MKKFSIWFTGLLLTALLGGCGLIAGSTPTPGVLPTSTPVVMPTEIPLPTEEVPLPTLEPLPATPSPTITPAVPIPTITPAIVMMISAEITMDDYSLRVGPGRLFERVGLYELGDNVTVFGREAGNNWVLVQTSDHRSGWMNVMGLHFTASYTTLPIFRVDNAQVIHGHVYLPGQIPATSVEVALTSSDPKRMNSRDDVTTNLLGEWVIYVPLDISGNWIIGPNGATCAASNAVSPTTAGGCTLLFDMTSREISLPLSADVSIEFELTTKNP